MCLQLVISGLVLVWAAVLVGSWLGWQLLRQNGRILLRLDELEKRLNELEFGEGEEPTGLPLGNEAPPFELPSLADERKSLAQFRGQSVLLIFFNPDCGYCRDLAPKLATLATRSRRGHEADGPADNEVRLLTSPATAELPLLLILTTGEPGRNREFFAEHNIGCPVLLQNDGAVAKAYQVNGTPAGYLVDTEGKIASELAMGADAVQGLATKPCGNQGNEGHASSAQLSTLNSQPVEQSLLTSAATNGNGRANRFGNRSLARSKIERDGLKAGTLAPSFRLPRLDGRGDLTLGELRGKSVLLVFSDPHCGPCQTLAPELEKFYRAQTEREVGRVTPCAPQAEGMFQNGAHGVTRPTLPSTSIAVVMISKGEPKENRAKVKEHGLTFPVVLQQQWEISRRYAMFATPVAYLIDEAGMIAQDVAVGSDAIQDLMGRAERLRAKVPAVV